MINEVRELYLDIETSPINALVWELWNTNVVKVVEESHILMIGYSWGDGPVLIKTMEKEKTDEKLVRFIHNLLANADIVIGQNSDAFDIKRIYARFAHYKLPPPKPFRTLDTKKIAKSKFGFASNSLDSIGEYLGYGGKRKHIGIEMWVGCMKDDPKAWADMARYCKRDVVLLKKIAKHLRPFGKTPIIATEGCPRCGSRHNHSRGIVRAARLWKRRFQCQACAGWWHEPLALPDQKKPGVAI